MDLKKIDKHFNYPKKMLTKRNGELVNMLWFNCIKAVSLAGYIDKQNIIANKYYKLLTNT